MEAKTNATVVMVIVLIFLFIAVIYKIKIEKKIKSSAIFADERVKDIFADKGETQTKKPNLWGIPS